MSRAYGGHKQWHVGSVVVFSETPTPVATINNEPWHKACHDSLMVIQFGDRYVQVNNDDDNLDSGI